MNRLTNFCIIIFTSVAFTSALAYDWDASITVEKIDFRSEPDTYHASIAYYYNGFEYEPDIPFDETAFTQRLGMIGFSISDSSDSYTQTLTMEARDLFPGFSLENSIDRDKKSYTGFATIRNSESPHSFSFGLSKEDFNQSNMIRIIHEPNPIIEIGEMVIVGSNRSLRDRLLEGSESVLTTKGELIYSDISPSSNLMTSELETKTFDLEYDYYLSDWWTIGSEFQYSELDLSFSTDLVSWGSETTLSLGSQRLWNFAKNRWVALNASISYHDFENETTSTFGGNFSEKHQSKYKNHYWGYQLIATYYLNQRTSISAEGTAVTGWNTDSVGIFLSHYLTERIYANFAVRRLLIDERTSSDIDTFFLRIGSRL